MLQQGLTALRTATEWLSILVILSCLSRASWLFASALCLNHWISASFRLASVFAAHYSAGSLFPNVYLAYLNCKLPVAGAVYYVHAVLGAWSQLLSGTSVTNGTAIINLTTVN